MDRMDTVDADATPLHRRPSYEFARAISVSPSQPVFQPGHVVPSARGFAVTLRY